MHPWIKVINAGHDLFWRGQTLRYNLKDLTMGGNMASEKIFIDAPSKTIMGALAKSGGDFSVRLGYWGMGNQNCYPICETRWDQDHHYRCWGFLFKRGNSRTLRFQVFPYFKNQPEAEYRTPIPC